MATSSRPAEALPPGGTIAVAMSGGVDSSVAAALCVAAGYRVFGIMLRLWAEDGAAGANKCCTAGAIDDARAVAEHLGIPFSVLDAREAFKAQIVDGFLAAAQVGQTLNPCFACNRQIRFRWLLERAMALGADALATGHSARVVGGPKGPWRLLRGLDPSKDQSYMLHRLGQAQLARACFPVGEHPKSEVRAMAARFGLPVADRPDSVDLCWTGGLTEGRKIAALADTYHRPFAPHDCTGPVGFVAAMHCSFSQPNTLIQESVRAFYTGWYKELVTELPVIRDGHALPMEGPGLGTELLPAVFERSDLSVRKSEVDA